MVNPLANQEKTTRQNKVVFSFCAKISKERRSNMENLSQETRQTIWFLVVNYQAYFAFIFCSTYLLLYFKRKELHLIKDKFIRQSNRFTQHNLVSTLKMTVFALLFILYIISNAQLHFSSEIKLLLSLLYMFSVLFICNKEIGVFFNRVRKNHPVKKVWKETVMCWCTPIIIVMPAMWIYHLFEVPFNAQGLNRMPTIALSRWFELNVYGIPNVISEEIFNLLVLLIFASILRKFSRTAVMILSSILMSLVFGWLHIFAWNTLTALSIFLSHVTIALFFVYIRDVKPLILCHIINNLLATSVITGMSVVIKPIVMLTMTVPVVVWLVVEIIKKEK